ncbi:hypothetical protein K435DRAFT_804132 [Dendrothele bispora CBS 962.96]|uniref:Uncharacterized protein n=1 Tax=Dendrothele bispora (strain CBS 962.96) TaxID=1314807 RepID=A0A4S8LFB4_DENBC|nr:hypothetical protein K435DRAFT_804132 [Dendrothele bispora CBS 962.96]
MDQTSFHQATLKGGEPTQGVGTTRNQEEEQRLREERDKARDELQRADREVDDLKEEVQKGNRSYNRLYADFKELRREDDDLKGELTLTVAVKGTVAEMMEPVAGNQRKRTMDARLEETSDEESDEEEETSRRGKGKSGPKRFGRMPGPLKTLHTPGNIQRNTLKSEIIPIQMPESAAQVTELAARAQEPNNWEAVRRVQTILAVFQAMNHHVKRNKLQMTRSWWNVVQDLSMRWRIPGWMESAKKLEVSYNWGQDIEVLKVIKVNQANLNMSLEEQAKWMVVNATPFTHPGVLISKPRSRPANDPGVQLLPSLVIEANGKYQQMLLITQPYLYEQLLGHWNVTMRVQRLAPIRPIKPANSEYLPVQYESGILPQKRPTNNNFNVWPGKEGTNATQGCREQSVDVMGLMDNQWLSPLAWPRLLHKAR